MSGGHRQECPLLVNIWCIFIVTSQNSLMSFSCLGAPAQVKVTWIHSEAWWCQHISTAVSQQKAILRFCPPAPTESPPLLRQGWLCGLHRRTNVGKEEELNLWLFEKFIEAAPQQWERTYTRAGTPAALLDMELLLWAWLGKTKFLAGGIQDVHLHAYNLLVTVLHQSLLLWFTEFQPYSQLPEQQKAGRNTDLQHQRGHA